VVVVELVMEEGLIKVVLLVVLEEDVANTAQVEQEQLVKVMLERAPRSVALVNLTASQPLAVVAEQEKQEVRMVIDVEEMVYKMIFEPVLMFIMLVVVQEQKMEDGQIFLVD
jgi:hypothetical protein